MKVIWTAKARANLVPLYGEPWTVVANAKKSATAIGKAGGGVVPDAPTVAAEVARGTKLRVGEPYTAAGGEPKDRLGCDLVDRWCATAGVAFATEVLVGIARKRHRGNAAGKRYQLRYDAQPWLRLREHLVVASPEDLAAARANAAPHRKGPLGDLPIALAFTFCDPKWVAADLAKALETGYGNLAILTCLTDAAAVRRAIKGLLARTDLYQLIEHGYRFMPNAMRVLTDADAALILDAARRAWTKQVRKPWLELVGSIPTTAAHACLREISA